MCPPGVSRSRCCRWQADSARAIWRDTRPAARRSPFDPRGGTNAAVGSWVGDLDQTPTVRRPEERTMTLLKWALIFFLVSIVAGILGFTGISAASADVARFLFYVFVVIFLVLLILGLTIFRV
jgi:uncharacterized membrane protein YtjA (UPF0391 family)